MTDRERFMAALNGERADRLPVVEWAGWWNLTAEAWERQGMPAGMDVYQIRSYYGLDSMYQFWVDHRMPGFPQPVHNGGAVAANEAGYEDIKKLMFSKDYIKQLIEAVKAVKPAHDRGETTVWYTLEGFFWFPRTLLGIENHFYAFYDCPELMHRMNKDHADYSLMLLEELYKVITPEFMTFAEDMSYNHGPMLSRECYNEFMKPYYEQLIPFIKSKGTKVLIDSDGDVEPLIPWFLESGIEGILPLERQAGVDVNNIRANYPEWIMIGGYDKTIMHKGEEAMRAEFERILPAMKSGRYIPSVDHQTPPDVTVENYRIYVKLLKEYACRAME